MRLWLSSMTIHILLVVVKMKSTTERNAMSEQRYPRHAAEGFLRENLPANAKDVEERARAAGIAQRTLARARQMLGVYAQPDGVWRLPGEHEVIDRHAMTKWPHHPTLRKKPHAPSKGRGPVQRAGPHRRYHHLPPKPLRAAPPHARVLRRDRRFQPLVGHLGLAQP